MKGHENLIPAKKGEVRNPKGKPVGTKNRSTILLKWLPSKIEITDPETKQQIKVTLEDAINLAIIKKAADGDVAAFKEIQDTLHGKIKEQTEHSGEIKTTPTTIIFTDPKNEP